MENTTENKPNRPEIVWHYTKMETLEKIFPPEYLKNGKENGEYKDGDINFRLTNIKFKNDPSEGLVFRNFFEDNRKDISSHLPENLQEIVSNEPIKEENIDLDKYVFSATCLKDSFVFWNAEYAGLNGISIGIKNYTSSFGVPFQKVIYLDSYNKDEFIKQISEYIYNIYSFNKYFFKNNSFDEKDLVQISLNCFSCLCKQSSWKGEEEMRFIRHKDDVSDIKIEVIENKIRKSYYEYFDKKLINYIILGPECNGEQVNAVREYLKANKYITADNEIDVSRSHAFDLRHK